MHIAVKILEHIQYGVKKPYRNGRETKRKKWREGMSVVSYIFIVFFAVTVLIYYIVPKKIQWWVLLAASAVFYAYSGIDDLLIVVGTAFLVYPLTMLMEKNLEEQDRLLLDADKRAARKIKQHRKETKEISGAGIADRNRCAYCIQGDRICHREHQTFSSIRSDTADSGLAFPCTAWSFFLFLYDDLLSG